MKYSIVTFGCRVNQADSLCLEEQLRQRGAIEAAPAEADLVIVNTCSVTATADQGARQAVRRIARDNPSARIVVTGCYATRRPEEVSALPGVVRVVANSGKLRTIPLLESAGELTTAERFGGGAGACGAAIEPGVAGRTAFTLRVQSGCEQECSYCIIPATRGAGASLPVGAVLEEVRRIAAAGFKEVALTGVHLGSYGRDLAPGTSLLALLRALSRVEADLTFRISSLEPMDCTPGIVDLVGASGGRFAPHFHLPLQHASDRVLSRMRRPYTLGEYRRLVASILERLPHASIGSDVIVGFPGETDDEFRENVRYLPESGLSHLHVFPYSDRPGTAAARMADKVPGALVRARALEVRRIGAELSSRFRASQVGSIRAGLTLEDGTLVVTDNYLKVRIAPGRRRNERVGVRIDAAAPVLTGSVLPDSFPADRGRASGAHQHGEALAWSGRAR
jgi:threonylcarbamoyladenosine tRNA methylthiotransferase MtaB